MKIKELKEFLQKIPAAFSAAEGLVGYDRLAIFKPLETEWKSIGGRKAAVDALALQLGLKAAHDWAGSELHHEGAVLVNFFETRFGLDFKPTHSSWQPSIDAVDRINEILREEK